MRWHYEPDGEYVVVQSDLGTLRCRVFGNVDMLRLAVTTMYTTLLRRAYGAKH